MSAVPEIPESPESPSVLGILCDHRVLFPLSLCFYYTLPYVAALLHLPGTNLSFPGIWMWGFLLFALASYFLGSTWTPSLARLARGLWRPGPFRVGVLALLSVLVFSYSWFAGLGAALSLGIALALTGSIYLVFRETISPAVSVLLIFSSFAIIMAEFLALGGVPVVSPTRLVAAKLSPLRRLALGIFLLGVVSLYLAWRRRRGEGIRSQALVAALFVLGAALFLLNGARTDFFAVLFALILVFLSTHTSKPAEAVVIIIASAVLLTLLVYPGVVAQLRQRFNFQVLRHILLFVTDPLSGSTHGTISLGLRQHFVGPRLIYGEGENWTLTSTWIGPAYLDFGLPGVFITMFAVAIVLESLRRAREGHRYPNLDALYITTLAILLSLFQEGADLSVAILLVAVSGAALTTTLSSKPGPGRGSRNGQPGSGRLGARVPRASTVLGVLCLVLISLSFEAEFAWSRPVGGAEEKVGGAHIGFARNLKANNWYHLKIIGQGTQALAGSVTYAPAGSSPRTVAFDGVLWEAEVDEIDLGWIHLQGDGTVNCTFDVWLSREPDESRRLDVTLRESPLSPIMPTHTLIIVALGPFLALAVLFARSVSRM